MGQYEKSVEVVSKAIPLDPKPVRYANRGYGYLALGDYTAALTDAETGISLNANYTTTYGVKALALKGMGRNAEALAAIDTALTLEPGKRPLLAREGKYSSREWELHWCPGILRNVS